MAQNTHRAVYSERSARTKHVLVQGLHEKRNPKGGIFRGSSAQQTALIKMLKTSSVHFDSTINACSIILAAPERALTFKKSFQQKV
ncbi:unnamed protein product [Arctia plantaginis]|uniref:Uncharacterized protein n=1 Tax=Arctia plantaginis TaxID=874455 RepID=A0A8S1AB72_ARCPL|nr:unnamed protein product [Arctia plantaginis]